MSQIKKGAFLSYITVAFNIISGFFFTPYLIAKVGTGAYGIYTLVITFLNYFLIDFGLGNSVVKYISMYRARNEIEKINKFIAVVFKIFASITLMIGIILFILYFFVESFFDGLSTDEIIILKKMYIISGTSAVLLFLFVPLDGILNAYECFTQQKISELLRKVFVILFSVMALSISSNIVLISAVNAVVGIAVVILKLVYVKKFTPVRPAWDCFDVGMVKSVGKFSFWIALIMIEQRFIIPLAPTILGRYSNSIEIGIFSIATTVEGYVYTISSCLNGLFLPKLTKMEIENKRKDINNLFILVGRIQAVIIGLLITVFVVFGKEFITAWVGNEFEKSYWPILLLISPTIITYAQEIANSILMIEHEKLKYKVICYGVGVIISTIVSCVLAPRYGALGSAIGIAICIWTSHVILMNIVYEKTTFLDIKAFFREVYTKLVPVIFFLSAIGIIINNHFNRNSTIFLILKMAAFTVLFLLFIWFFVMKTDEKKMLLGKVKEIKENRHEKKNFG